MKRRAIALAFFACSLPAAAANPPSVPYTLVSISGSQSTGTSGAPVTYRAYQAPGETYRIVCQEPCAISEELIFAAYAGFQPAKQQLVALAGIDSLPSLQPFDIHLNADSWCGPYNPFGFAGDAGTYFFPGTGIRGSFGCFWDVEKALPQPPPYLPNPFTPADAIRLDRQLLRVHEYGHTLFYVRHWASYEDLVKAFSFDIASLGGTFITDPCDPYLRTFGQGRLVYTLCRDAGFAWSDLAPALRQLDIEFHAGQGEGPLEDYGQPNTTSVSQLRTILAARLGPGATDAFLGAGFDAATAGDEATAGPAGGAVSLGVGGVTLHLPAGALGAATTLSLGQLFTAPAASGFDFNLSFRIAPDATTFSAPAWLTFRYDPFATRLSESTLRLNRDSGSWQEVPGSVVDVANGTVSAPVSSLGRFALLGSPRDATAPARVLPTVASTAGQFGSFYRTAVQLVNPTYYAASGKLVFHRAGASGGASDPSLTYSLGAWEVKTIADLLPALGASGSGSVDLVVTTGAEPGAIVRVFNDGAAGTTGVTEDPIQPGAALLAGQRGVLILPPTFATQRMNVGVRTFAGGASVAVTLRSAAGAVVKQLTKSWGPSFYEQVSAAEFLGGASLAGGESVEISVTSGSLVVYGATGDDTTNDPSLQVVRPILAGPAVGEPLTVPTVVSAPGQFGAFYRTAVQLQNPTASPVAGSLVFHPAGASASASDPSLPYTIAPGQTQLIPDLLPAMGRTGSGSLDVIPTSGPAPRMVVRVFNDAGAAGTFGLTEEALPAAAALHAGEHAFLVMPADTASFRMNVGVRTLERGAKVSVLARSALGYPVKTVTKSWGPDFYEQVSAAELLGGTALPANGSVEVLVDGGSLFVYGATADNRTNDPSLQLPRRQPLF